MSITPEPRLKVRDDDLKERVDWLTDRVWNAPDNLHKRVGLLEVFKEQWTIVELPNISKLIQKLRDDFEGHKYRIFGNGEEGYVEKKITEAVSGLEKKFESMVDGAVEKAFVKREDREEKKREKWDIRTWGIIVMLAAGLVDRFWDNIARFLGS